MARQKVTEWRLNPVHSKNCALLALYKESCTPRELYYECFEEKKMEDKKKGKKNKENIIPQKKRKGSKRDIGFQLPKRIPATAYTYLKDFERIGYAEIAGVAKIPSLRSYSGRGRRPGKVPAFKWKITSEALKDILREFLAKITCNQTFRNNTLSTIEFDALLHYLTSSTLVKYRLTETRCRGNSIIEFYKKCISELIRLL